jgi:hypothetical protein
MKKSIIGPIKAHPDRRLHENLKFRHDRGKSSRLIARLGERVMQLILRTLKDHFICKRSNLVRLNDYIIHGPWFLEDEERSTGTEQSIGIPWPSFSREENGISMSTIKFATSKKSYIGTRG